MSGLTCPSKEMSFSFSEMGKLLPLLMCQLLCSEHPSNRVSNWKAQVIVLWRCMVINLKGRLPKRPAQRPVHHPSAEALEPNAFSFLCWRQHGEAVGASSPGLDSTRTWGFEKISYFSEPQFSHLQKGYDNTHGHRTAVRVKWVSSQPQL